MKRKLTLQKERKARRARKARKELEAAPVVQEPAYREYTPEPANEFICTPIYTAPEPEPVPVESPRPWYRFGH